MKKGIKLFFIMIFMIIMIGIGEKNVQAKSYAIHDMDIQATINQDGSLTIQQEITYQFNGSYNGIYINIPYNLEDTVYDETIKENEINDNLYNGNNIKVNSISALNNNGVETKFTEVDYATNGRNAVYTNTKEYGMQKIKIYSPSSDTTKIFKIN